MANCPRCGQHVIAPFLQEMTASATFSHPGVRLVAYVCPHAACQTILGLEADPISLVHDVKRAVVHELTKKR